MNQLCREAGEWLLNWFTLIKRRERSYLSSSTRMINFLFSTWQARKGKTSGGGNVKLSLKPSRCAGLRVRPPLRVVRVQIIDELWRNWITPQARVDCLKSVVTGWWACGWFWLKLDFERFMKHKPSSIPMCMCVCTLNLLLIAKLCERKNCCLHLPLMYCVWEKCFFFNFKFYLKMILNSTSCNRLWAYVSSL